MVVWGCVFVAAQTIILLKRLDGEEQCGIPIIWWSEVWISIQSTLGFVGLLFIILALTSQREDVKAPVVGFSIILILSATVVWTTYGYILIGSADNNCGLVEEMSGWQSLMTTLLCIGSIPYLVLLLVLFVSIGKCIAGSCCKSREPGSSNEE